MAQYRFLYPNYGDPDSYPDYSSHSGQLVTVVRRKPSSEYEWLGDAMFIVRTLDGWQGEVFHSELHSIDYPWPNTHDKNGNLVR